MACQKNDGRRRAFEDELGTWHEAVSSAFNSPFVKEVSQNPLAFDVAKSKQ